MVQVRNDYPAAQRARWLAELAEALDEAGTLLNKVAPSEGNREAAELRQRIETVRLEVEAMRVGRSMLVRQDLRPEWTEQVPWRLSA